MHELAVTEEILRVALEHAERAQATRITDIHLVIGTLSTVVDDSVQFYFDFLSPETIAAGAKLGVVGENNEGLVEIVKLDAVKDLRERAEVQRVVKAENADREQLYKEIAAAENVDLAQLPRIRETYAETMRNKARAGDWIQLPDGTWKQK